MYKIVLFVALFGIALSKECDSCMEMIFTGAEGADAMNEAASKDNVPCASPVKHTCNATEGEDTCKTGAMSIDLTMVKEGTTFIDVTLELGIKGCVPASVTCAMYSEMMAANYGSAGFTTANVTSCTMESESDDNDDDDDRDDDNDWNGGAGRLSAGLAVLMISLTQLF